MALLLGVYSIEKVKLCWQEAAQCLNLRTWRKQAAALEVQISVVRINRHFQFGAYRPAAASEHWAYPLGGHFHVVECTQGMFW